MGKKIHWLKKIIIPEKFFFSEYVCFWPTLEKGGIFIKFINKQNIASVCSIDSMESEVVPIWGDVEINNG